MENDKENFEYQLYKPRKDTEIVLWKSSSHREDVIKKAMEFERDKKRLDNIIDYDLFLCYRG
ncbi:hypothetical protein Hanom_Chr06g00576361 [Helianthus anomalus]